jgi:hypothetical protein
MGEGDIVLDMASTCRILACANVQTRGAAQRKMKALVKGASIMKFILCAALAAMTGMAGATVNKCVDADGQVLLTDAECPQGSRAEDYMERVPVAVTSPLASAPAPRSRWADLPRPQARKTVSTDVATLQAARVSLQMQDEMHKQRRLISSR